MLENIKADIKKYILRRIVTKHGNPKYRYEVIDPDTGNLLTVRDTSNEWVAGYVQIKNNLVFMPFWFERLDMIGQNYSKDFLPDGIAYLEGMEIPEEAPADEPIQYRGHLIDARPEGFRIMTIGSHHLCDASSMEQAMEIIDLRIDCGMVGRRA